MTQFLKNLKITRGRFFLLLVSLIVFIGIVVSVVVFALMNRTSDKQKDLDEKKRLVITTSTDKPSEVKPGKDYKWDGLEGDPKYIKMPSANIEGYIQNVGIDQNKEIAVPNNVFIAGWFANSAIPGAKGLSIIDGHVDGTSKPGIFRGLNNLKEGDEFEIELGNGDTKKYRVLSVNMYTIADAPEHLFSQDPSIESQLNLITCGGTYLESEKTYDQRIIVTSELIPSSDKNR